MLIEEGVEYRTRDGRRIGPMVPYKNPTYCWTTEDGIGTWRADGAAYDISVPWDTDLIAPWHDTTDVNTPTAAPVRVQILQAGAALTHGERDKEYGPPAINMAASGALKQVFRAHLNRDMDPAELEAIDMCLTKMGRIATGTPKLDTYVDAATYIAIAGEIALTPTTTKDTN